MMKPLKLTDGRMRMSEEQAEFVLKEWLLNKLYWSNKNTEPIPYEVMIAMQVLPQEVLNRINAEVKALWD
jgi:hypothetical protein